MKERLLLTLATLAIAACGGEQGGNVAADATPDCRLDSRIQIYVPGMSATADDGVQVALLTASPAPPTRFDNFWTMQILDSQDQPIADAELRVEPFMPDHGHGTPRPPIPVAGEAVGSFDMGPFDLWMPGVWELRLEVVQGDTTSLSLLSFCIEE
jgi:hypothetical protein